MMLVPKMLFLPVAIDVNMISVALTPFSSTGTFCAVSAVVVVSDALGSGPLSLQRQDAIRDEDFQILGASSGKQWPLEDRH